MKKILNSTLLLCLAATSALTVTSCKDDDNQPAPGTNREFMTMFVCDYTRGKGADYPYNSGLDGAYSHGNTIHLYWYGVDDCAGYQVQMAYEQKVTLGPTAWAAVQGTSDLVVDTIFGPKQLDMMIYNLPYNTRYRFAIRALSKLDKNIKGDESTFEHASNWYGHGNGRQWQEYFGVQTSVRYAYPKAIYVNQAETTENTMTIYLRQNVSELGETFASDMTPEKKQAELDSYYENFNIGEDGSLGYQILTVVPSPSNPNSTVGEKWSYYKITDEDRARGHITIDGLTANSTYVINVIDPRVTIEVDQPYNTLTEHTDGKPGEPILLSYDELYASAADLLLPGDEKLMPAERANRSEVFELATSKYQAAPISPALYDFISNTDYAEGQTFYLEGGKTYYLDGNDGTGKGFVLATRPEDVAQGKRARVISGLGRSDRYNQGTDGKQWMGPYSMFIFGRSPEPGEGGEIRMKKLEFRDIDFDNPEALNYGDNIAGLGSVAGNYFFNMYSDGMAITLDSLIIENCTFKRCVRGFIREQGPNYKVWNHVLIKNNLFYDCGYYNQGAGGYCWIAGINQAGSNLYKDFKAIENTFFDSPFPAFFSEENVDNERDNGAWNITFSNNTLINFNTRANGAIFKMRQLPDGSVYNVENNLFVLCKLPGDQRQLQMWGADIRETQPRADGSAGVVTLNFHNNWSTNNDLTDGSIFSGNPWTATSNNFGKLLREETAKLNGTLEVEVADISATELMIQPCPPFMATSANDQNMHRAEALDGTAKEFNVNLFFKNFDNEIVKNNVGAARWRQQ
ncbi:MAG: hypothetical protein IJ570_04200 [Prevotella sp.]|nr:hypothetical protein [Prevotella sp.]